MSSGVSGLRVRKRPGSEAVGGRAKKSRHGGNSLQQAQEPESGTGSSSNSRSKYSAEHNKMFELQEIVDDLEKRHPNKYTIEQLRAWGHMIMKKHDSHDHPPDKPFFKQRKEEQAAAGARSPGK